LATDATLIFPQTCENEAKETAKQLPNSRAPSEECNPKAEKQ
jgi:hypothetical protein